MSDMPKKMPCEDRLNSTFKERLHEVVESLSLDIVNDPFTKLLAHCIAAKEHCDALKAELAAVTAEREALYNMLDAHQWSGTAYGGYGSTARRCPECLGMHPEDFLNDGGGKYVYAYGKGHKPGCPLNAALAAARETKE
ncbi:MAG: hypothetical protein IPM64_17360 [Phycisphaerales bacterium]|nr:hypothetical protein [Phycisphaerales bacterium]